VSDEPTGRSVDDLTAESDVLAFFYAESVGGLSCLRDDAEELARFAARLGDLVRATGVAATAEHRAEFHRAAQLAARVAALTYRLVDTLAAID
jgi:hypothetical protein